MNVLVTGGTGFVGRAIVAELHRAGHTIHLLARHSESQNVNSFAARHSAQIRPGNILDSNSLKDACAGIDAVIHLVGIISETGRQTYEAVHVEGTRNMIEASRRAGVKRFIHMSALGTRPNARARYHQSKWNAEEIVRHSGLTWTIFRPSIIYGPNDGFVNLFARIARRSPVVPIIGKGESKFQPIAVPNVARAFVAALTEPRAENETFVLSGPEVFTLNEIVDCILRAMNAKRIKLHLPVPLARVQAGVLEFLFGRLLHKAPPLNRDQILMLQEDNIGNGKSADDLFGLKHESFQRGITEYLQR
ncbi:MAG TPA: complex I NDUFA9 subunit family protein [Verrucomicrobiae bacterium]|nr:complex I NDUFA9 subunit family protein [Verrucomicrobiae bacterium]